MSMLTVDLGGTHMRAAAVDTEGEISHRHVRPTPQDAPRPDALVDLMREVLVAAPATLAVIGVPGRVDHRRRRLDHAPNLPSSWAPYLSAAWLEDALGVAVQLVNDADLAAVGEAYFGAARGYSDVVYVTLSTGVGAGVLLDGRLLVGRCSIGEAGHHVIDRVAFAEGRPATFEQLASGRALERLGAEAGLSLPGAGIVAAMNAGDPVASMVFAQVVEAACVGVRNLAYLFTPEIIVIGGGLGRVGDVLYQPIQDHLARYGPPALAEPIRVVGAALGDDAGLIGAAAWERAFRM